MNLTQKRNLSKNGIINRRRPSSSDQRNDLFESVLGKEYQKQKRHKRESR